METFQANVFGAEHILAFKSFRATTEISAGIFIFTKFFQLFGGFPSIKNLTPSNILLYSAQFTAHSRMLCVNAILS